MDIQTRIPAIESANLLDSLRASDFDIPSAIGELIDNSIQANASEIYIKIEDIPAQGTRGKPYKLIDKIICGDNGHGMGYQPKGILHSCIKLGYSTRFNNRDSIGRFGVGMTLAGIRYATKIEVYSKEIEDSWYYVCFDLTNRDDLESGIEAPIKKEIPTQYANLVGQDSGTLVIWSGFDKFAEQELHTVSYEDKFEQDSTLNPFGKLNHWIGRTYRYYIWDNVKIYLNNKSVPAFDPLYMNTNKSQFPEDPEGKIVFEKEFDWPIHHKVREEGKFGEKSKILIKMTILPVEFREISGRGGKDFPGRYIEENVGVSILRNRREVLYDQIPYFQKDNKKIGWEDKDRWWGCEIRFNPELDEYFTVKNIKRGAVPVKDLKDVLFENIRMPRDKIISEVSTYWKKKTTEEDSKTEEVKGRSKLHETVEKLVIAEKNAAIPKAGINLTENERESRIRELTQGLDEVETAKWEAIFQAQPFSIKEDFWRGDQFIEVVYIDGKAVLQYNLNHVFFESISNIRKQIENLSNEEDNSPLAKQLNDLIDILLMSYAMARQRYPDNESYTVEDLMSEITTDWGRYLKKYTKAYYEENGTSD